MRRLLSIQPAVVGVLIAIAGLSPANGQERIFEFAKSGVLPMQFQSYVDSTGRAVIVYNTQTETVPRTYKTFFLFKTDKGPKELMLPLNLRVYQVVFKEDRFLFFLRTRDDYVRGTPEFDIFEISHDGVILKSHRYSYGKEKVLSTFNAYGAFYILSILKKSKEIRVRIFRDAADPVTFSYRVSDMMFDELADKDREYVFTHDLFELPLEKVYSFDKCFVFGDKLFLRTFTVKADKNGLKPGPTFLELSLNARSPGLQLRQIRLPYEGSMNCFPIGDKVFLYQPKEEDIFIGIASLSTFEMIKSFNLSGEGKSLLDSRLFGRKRQPKDSLKKLKLLNEGLPFIYPVPKKGFIQLSFGKYEYSDTENPGAQVAQMSTRSIPVAAGPGGSISTNVLTPGVPVSSIAPKPTFQYLVAYLAPDFTLQAWREPSEPLEDRVEKFMEEAANADYSSRYEIVPGRTRSFVTGFSNKTDTFVIWSISNN